VEMLVYTAVVGFVMSFALLFIFSLLNSYTRFRTEQEVTNNAHLAMEYIIRETKQASEVYIPTSLFATTTGQLSLEMNLNVPSDETNTFVDFFVDNGRLYMKRESQNDFPITSDRVNVTQLEFTHAFPTSGVELLTVEITVDSRGPANLDEYQFTSNLTSSASPRGHY